MVLMTTGYPNLQEETYAYQPDIQAQQLYPFSPQSLSSADLHQRPSSTSPNVQMRQPPARNRTPIQHQRASDSRARSHSRSEMLLAYAAEHRQVSQPPTQPSMTVVPSQSAPTTPQVFPGQSYSWQDAGGGYADPSSYFPSSMPPTSSSQMPKFPYQHAGSQFPSYYSTGRSTSHSMLAEISTLDPQETVYRPTQSQPTPQSIQPMSSTMQSFPPISTPLQSTPGELELMSSRPKPQCWDHGCNGRQFSTFSNLLRHQREKDGNAMKATCPYCGTDFTRTTARNGHMYGGKCKGRPDKEHSETSSTSGKERN